MAVKVLGIALCGAAIPVARCQVPRDSMAPIAANRVADTL